MKRGQVKISQCMIVKNEEKNIEHALSWGAGVVSEQIVVDTGSTDRTIDIARRMGAKVYEFPWIDDFSAAKNFAISKDMNGLHFWTRTNIWLRNMGKRCWSMWKCFRIRKLRAF